MHPILDFLIGVISVAAFLAALGSGLLLADTIRDAWRGSGSGLRRVIDTVRTPLTRTLLAVFAISVAILTARIAWLPLS